MNRYFLIFALVLLFASCTNQRQQKLDMIAAEEDKLYNEMMSPANTNSTASVEALYTAFVQDYPKDSLAPEFMFKKAQIWCNGQNSWFL